MKGLCGIKQKPVSRKISGDRYALSVGLVLSEHDLVKHTEDGPSTLFSIVVNLPVVRSLIVDSLTSP